MKGQQNKVATKPKAPQPTVARTRQHNKQKNVVLPVATASNVPARFVKPRNPAQKTTTRLTKPLVATVTQPNGKPLQGRESADSGIGRMNRQGTSIERVQGNHKNLRPDPPGIASEKRAERFLEKNMKAEDLLSPDAVRYCRLLDDPLNAPWGDEGEVPVRPLVYQETVPPSTTKTIRCFGQQEVIVPAGEECWVVFCVGAGYQGNFSSDDGDDIGVASPNYIGGVPGTQLVTLGAPNDGRGFLIPGGGATAGLGVGVAGYYYSSSIGSNPPSVSTAVAAPVRNALFWGNPVAFGDMREDDGSTYKYRPVAGGLLITPDETTFELGGHYDAMIIPQATNSPYVSAAVAGHGNSSNVADILALPDHCIQRADESIMVNWLPGRQDYSFLKTYPSGDVQSIFTSAPSLFVDAPNARVFVKISPPDNANAHKFVVSYTGFYEVAGQCVQQVGSVPRASPNIGSKIATSVQNNLNIELDDRSRQVTEGATLEVMKDHPKIGPMIENCDSMPKAKSTLSEIIDFGKDLLPLVGLLL